jgi:hypothetical protein
MFRETSSRGTCTVPTIMIGFIITVTIQRLQSMYVDLSPTWIYNFFCIAHVLWTLLPRSLGYLGTYVGRLMNSNKYLTLVWTMCIDIFCLFISDDLLLCRYACTMTKGQFLNGASNLWEKFAPCYLKLAPRNRICLGSKFLPIPPLKKLPSVSQNLILWYKFTAIGKAM